MSLLFLKELCFCKVTSFPWPLCGGWPLHVVLCQDKVGHFSTSPGAGHWCVPNPSERRVSLCQHLELTFPSCGEQGSRKHFTGILSKGPAGLWGSMGGWFMVVSLSHRFWEHSSMWQKHTWSKDTTCSLWGQVANAHLSLCSSYLWRCQGLGHTCLWEFLFRSWNCVLKSPHYQPWDKNELNTRERKETTLTASFPIQYIDWHIVWPIDNTGPSLVLTCSLFIHKNRTG